MPSAKRARLEVEKHPSAKSIAMKDTGKLQRAAMWGDERTVTRLLSKSVKVDAENRRKRNGTLLHMASENGHLQVVKVLLDHGANLNQASGFFHNCTPAHLAALEGHVEILSFLLSRGAFVDAKNKFGRTPLHLTTCYNQIECANLLFAFKADVNAKDVYNFTPLHLAARNGFVEIARMFLIMGADDTAASKHSHAMPLHFAAANGQSEVVKLFSHHNACLDVRDLHRRTPLYHAINNNKTETAELLLNHQNLDINDLLGRNNWDLVGDSLLHKKVKYGSLKTIEWLLSKGADVNELNIENRTPLHLAATSHPRVLKVLLRAGASVDATDSLALTPLHLAAKCGSLRIVKLLLSSGASVNAANSVATTPLHFSAMLGSPRVVKLLLSSGASVNAADVTARTPLHLAAFSGNTQTLKLLCSNGASVNATDQSEYTPLHYATARGNAEVVEFLLSAGADVNAVTEDDRTPLDLALNTSFIQFRPFARPLLFPQLPGEMEAFHRIDLDLLRIQLEFRQMLLELAPDRLDYREVLKQRVVKMGALNLNVSESNSLAVRSDDGLTSLRSKCEKEVERMKSKEIANGVSLFDILTKTRRQIVIYASNRDIARFFKSNIHLSEYPIYGSEIGKRFGSALKRAKLLESGHKFFHASLTGLPRLDLICSQKILTLLGNNDLQLLGNLVKSEKANSEK